MTSVMVSRGGEIEIPDDLRVRYGFEPETRVRLIETRSGILLVPLTDDPMNSELAREIEAWQELGADAWTQFPYAAGTT